MIKRAMDRSVLKAWYLVLVSLGLAFTFNFLFFDKLIGISALVFAVILLGVVWLLARSQRLPLHNAWWLMVLVVFFTLMIGIRANEFLVFLNVCATLGLLMILAYELTGTPAFVMKLRDYFALAVLVPFRMLGRALSMISLLGQVHSKVQRRETWIRVVKGGVMALPVLAIFGLLFSQADLAFSQFARGIFDLTISERTMQYLVLLGIAFVAALSFLSYIFSPRQAEQALASNENRTAVQPSRGLEVLVFLGLVAALFLLFIGFQITYLFGGESNIVNAGFTYAEYARRGFWELLAVGILSLIMLLATEKYAGGSAKKDKRFLAPAFVVIAEVMVVIVSAFKRLSLYIDAYGLTLQRFYAAGFIMLLSLMCILLAAKLLKAKPERFFAFGALLGVIAFIVAVNIVNPDAFIARLNMKQYSRTGKIDVFYMGGLSADAQAWKMELYGKLEGEEKEILRASLERQKAYLEENGSSWQSANLSRRRALELLQGFGEP